MNYLDKVICLIYIKSRLQKKKEKISRNILQPTNIFLGGSSWGSAFYIGCYKALLERYYNFSDISIYAVSAGALIGLCMCLNLEEEEIKRMYLEIANNADQNGVFFKMTKYHNIVLDLILKDKNAYKKVNNKLNIGISIYPNKHIIVNNWNSNEELRHDLHCTFHIPYYCTYNAIKNGKSALDGALTFDKSLYPSDMIYIGMIDYHINSYLTTKECTYPLLGNKFEKVVNDGYNKTLNFNFSDYSEIKNIKVGFLFPLRLWWILKLSSKLIRS